MSAYNVEVMDGERLGELTPRAEPKDAKDVEKAGNMRDDGRGKGRI